MSKIAKIKRIAKVLMNNPAMLNVVLERNDAYGKQSEKLGFKDGLPVIDMLDIFPDFSEKLEIFSLLDGGSLISDLALIKKTAAIYGNAKYFEIGTWRGESAANVAAVVDECVTLNLSETELRQLNLPEKYVGQQDFFSKDIPKITHLKGNSMNFDFSPYYGKYDVVFIDGDHHYESVKKDTETAFKLIKDKRSTIIWHDYGYSPEEIRYEVMCAILEGAPDIFRKNIFHVSNTMCALFTTKKFPVYFLKDKNMPDISFSVELKAKRL